jgi:glycosyltransferase involved in cell wall biosynthesis
MPCKPAKQQAEEQTQQQASSCGLVGRMVEGLVGESFSEAQVPREVCEACCQFPVPRAPDLNPVIASLVYSKTASKSFERDAAATQLVQLKQVATFARERLSQVDEPLGEFKSVGTTAGSHERLVSRWLGARTWRRAVVSSFGLRSPRIGLVGWNSKFGLGHVNRDLARELDVVAWLAPVSESSPELLPVCRYAPSDISDRELAEWLDRLDVVIFVEQPAFPRLTQVARQLGIPVICIPHWEWIEPGLEWVEDVDLMICPTRHTLEILRQWKRRFGFSWDLELVPWPIDVRRFRFRERQQCRSFLFVGGRGGCKAKLTGRDEIVRRKGLSVLLRAAEILPHCQFIVYSEEKRSSWPANVSVGRFATHNHQLYREGDVCVQPSYWEGIGLPLLECQAAGIPLVTIDAAPMNEYQPLATVPVRSTSVGIIAGGREIPVPNIEPRDVADVLANVHGRSIVEASRKAFEYVNCEHSWDAAIETMNVAIRRLVRGHERA